MLKNSYHSCMKIVADKYLYKLDELLPDGVDLTLFDPDHGFPENVMSADALLIRTVTKINKQTLPESGNLRFIGSATAGFDHVDRQHLQDLGVVFSCSEGCNANAVGEYVITVLYRWAEVRKKDVQKLRVGIVGCGHTGGAVLHYLNKLGIDTVMYDPPKSIREPGFKSDSLESLLACDVLTFHTPLTFNGEHATYHLCNTEWLLNRFGLVINASRGGVVNEDSLLEAVREKRVVDFVSDVWENEPDFSDECVRLAFIATPHIAGYSKQAKYRATEMIVNVMYKELGLQKKKTKLRVSVPKKEISIPEKMPFTDFLWTLSNIRDYDDSLRKLVGLPVQEKALKFAKLRSETETRDEFGEIVRKLECIPGGLSELSIFSRNDAATQRCDDVTM